MTELTVKRERFIEGVVAGKSATQSYKDAGYKVANDKVAGANAAKLLKNDRIRARIDKIRSESAKRCELDADYVLNGFREVAERCLQAKPVMYFDKVDKCMKQVTEFVEDPETGKTTEQGVWTFDSTGANRALELVGKHLGMFIDKKQIDGTLGVIFAGESELVDEDEDQPA